MKLAEPKKKRPPKGTAYQIRLPGGGMGAPDFDKIVRAVFERLYKMEHSGALLHSVPQLTALPQMPYVGTSWYHHNTAGPSSVYSTNSTQFGFLPIGYSFSLISVPFFLSIE